MSEEKNNTFESKVLRLDEIVNKLESGGLPLEESLRLFEEGTALVRQCGTYLDRTEQKISELIKPKDE